MGKNIALLYMSAYFAQPAPEGSKNRFLRTQTNEAAVSALWKDPASRPDKIVALCSDTVRTKPTVPAADGSGNKVPTLEYFRDEFLKQLGVQPEQLVAVSVPDSMEEADQTRAISAVLEQVAENDNLYIDLSGGMRDTATLLLIVARYLKDIRMVQTKKVLYSELKGNSSVVRDSTGLYNLMDLITAVDAFFSTGTTEKLKAYMKQTGETDPDILNLLDRIDHFADDLALCRVQMLKADLKAIARRCERLRSQRPLRQNQRLHRYAAHAKGGFDPDAAVGRKGEQGVPEFQQRQGQPGLHDSAAHKARDAGVLDGIGDGVQVVIQDAQPAQDGVQRIRVAQLAIRKGGVPVQHKALQQQEFLRVDGVASRLLEGAGGAEPQPCPAGGVLPCRQQKLQAVFHRVAAQRLHLQGRAVQFQRGAARKQRPHLCGEGFVQKIQRPHRGLRSSVKAQRLRQRVLALLMEPSGGIGGKLCHQPAINAVGPCRGQTWGLCCAQRELQLLDHRMFTSQNPAG